MSSVGRLCIHRLPRLLPVRRLPTLHPVRRLPTLHPVHSNIFNAARAASSSTETGVFKFGKMLDTNAVYKLDHYSKMNPTAISIKHLMDHGEKSSAAASFQFLRKEIPVRQANMIMELQHVSGEIKCQAEYQQIWQQYLQSFKEMISYENAANTPEVQHQFLNCLLEQRRRHADTVPQMATAVRGMLDMKDIRKHNHFKEHVQYILDRLYLNRISIHMLISNYQALHEKSIHGKSDSYGLSGMLGTVDPKCNIMEVVREAFNAASFICDREYLDSPDLSLKGFENKEKDSRGKMLHEKDSIKVAYVPAHLYHIFFEIFKNAMRATCEVCEERGLHELPYIKVRVYKTKDDVTICISDMGGGIPRSIVNNVFDYFFTTANQNGTEVRNVPATTGGLESEAHPMHGLGYGLPLSRLYARYFQGDVRLASIDGFGTNVYVYLNAISEEAQERLPVFSSVAVKKLQDTAPRQHDWTSTDFNSTKFPE